MKKQLSRWERAQKSEERCWESGKDKINSEKYLKLKKDYWNKIMDKIGRKVKIKDSGKFLDFGCGPGGLFLIYPKKKNLFCLDPLINYYLKLNPKLRENNVKYLSAKIESFNTKEKFDYVFGFNSLDHVDSIQKTLEKLLPIMKKDGYLIISVNCHNYKIIQKILLKFSFILDKPHPHQYMLKNYLYFLRKANFNPINIINIDNEIDYFHRKTQKKKKHSIKSIIRAIFHPFTYLNFLGIKTDGRKGEKRIFSRYIIIAKKE